jgi:1,4-dihydroxy-2-naphthoyl-CoA hydrolase
VNLIEALNIKYIRLNKDGFEAGMCLTDFHAQPFGYVNGGAILAFAEITAGHASNLLEEGRYHAVGQSITGNHMKTKRSVGYLYAKGELLHKGKHSHVWSIRILDENQRLVSSVTVQNALIKA